MTVTSTFTDSERTTGNGATTEFTTRFRFDLNAEVLVYLIDLDTEELILQEITTDYTVTGAGSGAAGTVTFVVAPTSDYDVKIVRSTALTQTTDYVNATKFPANTHEAALDKLTRIAQETNRDVSRAPQLPVSSLNYPAVFPDWGASTAGYIVRINTDGDALELASPTESALTATLTPTDGGFIVGDGSDFVVESGATARTSLGLGTMATQAASSVAITGGTVTGITDVAVADGGTGASTAANARTNLGLVIGTDVQAQDAELSAIAGLTSAADKAPYFTGSGTAALMDVTAAARTVLDDASTSDMRTTLGLAIGTHVQAYDAELAAIAGLTSAANKGIMFTGAGTAGTYDLTAAALTVLDDATVSDMVDTLGGAAAEGSGALVRKTSPTLVTPNIGVATGTSFNGFAPVAATTTVGAKISLPEGTDNGAHKITLKAADSMAADYTIEFPAAVPGGDGYTLAFTTGGVATFVAPGAAAAGGANTNVQFNSTGALGGDSGFTYSGSGAATLTTSLTVGGNATAAGKVIFKEDTDNGSNTCTLSGPQSTGDVTITLPASTGTVVLEDNAVALTGKTGYNSAIITAPTTTVGGNIKLLEGTNNGTNTVTIQAPASLSDITVTLPSSTGTIALTSDITSGSWVKISSQTASSSASIAFTGLSSTYRMYLVTISSLLAATDATYLSFRTSTNNGSSYDSGVSDYGYVVINYRVGNTTTVGTSNGDSKIDLCGGSTSVGDNAGTTNDQMAGYVYIHNPSATGATNIDWQLGGKNSSANYSLSVGHGGRLANADVDAIQFLMSSGNIASGTFTLYGLTA